MSTISNKSIESIKSNKVMETKVIKIDGMSCKHCSASVEKALNAIDGVEATVDLGSKTATLKLSREVNQEELKDAVEEAGYWIGE
jgi:copper chaperone CopZ